MPRDFFPRRDAEALEFTGNFARVIEELAAELHLTPQQIADYVAAQSAFAVAYLATQDGRTRSPVAIIEKDELRRDVESKTRALARILRAMPNMEAAVLARLGLSAIAGPRRRETPAPAGPPVVRAEGQVGSRLIVKLYDAATGRNRRPADVHSAALFVFVGDLPPDEPGAWSFAMNTTRPVAEVSLPADLPIGTKVWVCAYWLNSRAVAGRTSTPASAYFQNAGLEFDRLAVRNAAA